MISSIRDPLVMRYMNSINKQKPVLMHKVRHSKQLEKCTFLYIHEADTEECREGLDS